MREKNNAITFSDSNRNWRIASRRLLLRLLARLGLAWRILRLPRRIIFQFRSSVRLLPPIAVVEDTGQPLEDRGRGDNEG